MLEEKDIFINPEEPEWDWGDIDFSNWSFESEENVFDGQMITQDESTTAEPNIYYLENYGEILDLDEYLDNDELIIELLEHATSKDQFDYIVSRASKNACTNKLLQYLISKDYDISDFTNPKNVYIGAYRRFTSLIKHLFKKSFNNEQEILTLLTLSEVEDDEIYEYIVRSNHFHRILENNYSLKNEKMFTTIITYFKTIDISKRDFSFLNLYSNLTTDNINELFKLGYKITKDSPCCITENNEIMRNEFLLHFESTNKEVLKILDEEMKNIKGGYYRLICINNKKIFTDYFINSVGVANFFQILKYIELSDTIIDIDSLINNKQIDKLMLFHNTLNNSKNFNLDLFCNLVTLFNQYEIISNINHDELIKNKENIIILLKQESLLPIKNIYDLEHISDIIKSRYSLKIANAKNSLELKKYIAELLTNIGYFEIKKLLVEAFSFKKLLILKNCLKNPKTLKIIDHYIYLAQFFENLDKVDDYNFLKGIAISINEYMYKEKYNSNYYNLESQIYNLYVNEINDTTTELKEFLTIHTYQATDYTFNDGTNVKEKRVPVVHIPEDKEFNFFIHVLNAYEKGITGTIESIIKPKIIGQSYICLSGVSDEYNRICMPKYRDSSKIKLIYTKLPQGSLMGMNSRDTGIDAISNSKHVHARSQFNFRPFRRTVRNTKSYGSEHYNEYDIYRDGLYPAGILFIETPSELEINAAAYLGVPLVKSDKLSRTYRDDFMEKYHFHYTKPEEEYYDIKEHSSETVPITLKPTQKIDYFLDSLKSILAQATKETSTYQAEILHIEEEKEQYCTQINNQTFIVNPTFFNNDLIGESIDYKELYYREVKQIFLSLLTDFDKEYMIDYVDLPDKGRVLCEIYKERETFANINEFIEYQIINQCLFGNGTTNISYARPYYNNLNTSFDFISEYEINQYNLEELDTNRIYGLLDKIDSLDADVYIKLLEPYINKEKQINRKKLIELFIERKNSIRNSVEELLLKLQDNNLNKTL